MIADSIGFVVDRGREAVYDAEHFFDGYKADRDYALATLRAAREAGARTLVLCDTNGGTLTDELTRIVDDVRGSLDGDPDAPAVTWGIHTHNDAELAVANSMAAVAAGIRHVQGTINGYGERAGNANMVSILANLALKTEHELVPAGGGRLEGLTELSRSVAEIANVTPERLPALRRALGVRPQGRRPRRGGGQGRAVATSTSTRARSATSGRLVVSELGGRANTSIRARQLGHELEGVVDPRELSQLIKQLEAEGLAFEGAEASFELLIRRHAADYARAVPDRRLHLPRRAARRARAARRGDRQGRGRRRDAPHGRRRQRPGQRARRRAAQGAARVLPGHRRRPPRRLQGPHPRRRRGDRRPDPGRSSTRQDGARTWSTMGSDTNIIAASASALADSLEYAIWKSGAELRRRDERHFTTAVGRAASSPIADPATATRR